MAFDEAFLKGLQLGSEMSFRKKQLQTEQKFREWQQKYQQQQLGLEQKKAMFDRAYKMKMINQGVPIYTFTPEGGVQQVGNVPKGSKVVPPAQMMTPQQKAEEENKQRQTKELETATQEWAGGKAFLNTLKSKWLETKPPSTGVLGIGGAGVIPQPFYGMQQKVGSLFQWTENQKKDNLYVSYANALKSRLAKGGIIGKDVGNLSVQEQQWVMQGIPGLMDYKDVGSKKIENMKDMLDSMYYARKTGYKTLDEMLTDKGQNYFKGQVITQGKKSYKVIGGDLVNDPDIEEIK